MLHESECLCEESKIVYCDEPKSAFCGDFKYSNRTMSYTLEKKRLEFLQKQKEKRTEAFDEKRDLSHLFEDDPERMECESSEKPKRTKKFPFGYKLMGSEWLTEVPEDLTENWLIKLCPEGIRYLVVANRALTTCYYQNGRSSMKFKSKLPGGNADTAHKFTLLDCVYNKKLNTLFIYDVLAWNSVSLLNAEVQMRFCWLKSKFDENPEMLEINPTKNFKFVLMEFFPADKSVLQEKLFTPFLINNEEEAFHGILFYHKEGHYIFKRSPLVGWLKTFMVPEILHIDVHPCHLVEKPENYESVEQYLSDMKRRTKKEIETVEMLDVEEVEDINLCND